MGCTHAKASAPQRDLNSEVLPNDVPRLLGRLESGCKPLKSSAAFGQSEYTVSSQSLPLRRRKRDVILGGPSSRRRQAISWMRHKGHDVKERVDDAVHVLSAEVQHAESAVSHALHHMGHEIHHVGHEVSEAMHHMGHKMSHALVRQGKVTQSKPSEKSFCGRLADCLVGICNPQVLCNSSGSILGALAKSVLVHINSDVLGVNMSVGDIKIDATHGIVDVYDLIIENPEGYYSEYLMRADHIYVDVNMQALLQSFASVVDVEEVVFKGIDVIMERKLETSNLNDVMLQLSGPRDQPKQPNDANLKEDSAQVAEPSQRKVIFHKVSAKDIGVKLTWSATFGHGIRMEFSDLSYDDFEKQRCAGYSCKDSIRILLRTLIKSLIANILGKHATHHLVHGLHEVENRLQNLERQVETVSGNCMPCRSIGKKAS
eukprot:TRINITY_DN108242_c0_g1_i1.p1 TRINITY_DN108242_c0_g1~~TRINITY_DN108242_c0_g1_i1.p1  ORF type:complete len:455 (-),score=70.62 TRINITY_DN108242_c0_g1_i1:64-1353(-)